MTSREAARALGLRVLALALACLVLCAACAEPAPPEAQVRAALGQIEAAAEAGDAGALRDLISDSYQDPFGHDKQRLGDFVRLHVLRHPRGRQVILRVGSVQLTSDATASVMLHAGFAGAGDAAFHADAYAIDLDLAREDEAWRVTWAQWKPAAPAELL